MTWKEDEVVPPGHSLAFKVNRLRLTIGRIFDIRLLYQEALHIVSTDVVAKVVFAEWFLKYNPIKRLRNVSKAFIELEVSSAR